MMTFKAQPRERWPFRRHKLAHGVLAVLVVGLMVSVPDRAAPATLDLSTPEQSNAVAVKVMGSTGNETTHTFMRFHIYGYAGENAFPMFSMNNYVVQKWSPGDRPGHYHLKHYEVGYYTHFDTDEPLTTWDNPLTGETLELEPFVLGPVQRLYTPDGVQSPGLAPQPLRINVIGDRVYVPAQTIESMPNIFTPDEWPILSSGPVIFWDSMYTFSAALDDVLDGDLSSAPAEIHMQNLTSWQPFLRMRGLEGRTMARAFGGNVSGFDALPDNVRQDFEQYTPEIFETDSWTQLRFDILDYYNRMKKARDDAAEG